MQIGVAVARIEAETLDDDLRAWSEAGIAAIECDYGPLWKIPPAYWNGGGKPFGMRGCAFGRFMPLLADRITWRIPMPAPVGERWNITNSSWSGRR